MLKRAVSSLIGSEAGDNRREAVLDYLLAQGLIDDLSLSRGRSVAQRTRQPVEQVLNQMGALSEDAGVQAYAAVTGCGIWSPEEDPVEVALGDLAVSSDFLRQKRLLPVCLQGDRLVTAACDPLDDEALAGLVFASGLNVRLLIARPTDWRRAFRQVYGEPAAEGTVDERKLELDVQRVTDSSADSESARFLSAAFEAAVERGASDIHFEPRRHDLRIRLRIDGRLVDHMLAPVDLAAPVVSRIKVLAGLDLGERRLPQDGRATFVHAGSPIDVRISTLPSAFGEAAVLRLLDRTAVGFEFEAMGFVPAHVALLTSISKAPHGIFLVTGPTGSGKTTTLYALLNSLAQSEKKILSIEDPIEYHFAHVVQTQAAPAIGMTFAAALRSFLRQDPDVILVGEIRDAETAAVAVQAAMTGHLVLASLHANDAVRVVPRLLDMGVEPFQLAAALLGTMAQRLVRRLCPDCRRERGVTAAEKAFVERMGNARLRSAFEGAGCRACAGSGFRGRIALAEGFLCDDAIAGAVARREDMSVIGELARRAGGNTLLMDGCAKAAQGLTTLGEVMAIAGP
jgi:type II secretory ATPase GspE/PulE/Tfp pilus assembly ATPase PilB-like protein